jgi:FAD/FMN-containing dehydrogenase
VSLLLLWWGCRLMLEKMNKVLGVDKEKQQLRVQGQMTLKEFYTAADEAHLSVPRFGLPWWQGLTLGGVFSTASHGSGNNVTHMIVSWHHRPGDGA